MEILVLNTICFCVLYNVEIHLYIAWKLNCLIVVLSARETIKWLLFLDPKVDNPIEILSLNYILVHDYCSVTDEVLFENMIYYWTPRGIPPSRKINTNIEQKTRETSGCTCDVSLIDISNNFLIIFLNIIKLFNKNRLLPWPWLPLHVYLEFNKNLHTNTYTWTLCDCYL